MAETLPLRALVKLSGLNTSGQRYSDRLLQMKSTTVDDATELDFKVVNNSQYISGEEVTIQGVTGMPDPSDLTIGDISGSDTIEFYNQTPLNYLISSFETFKIVDGSTFYYLRVYIESGNTINVGSEVIFNDVPSPLDAINDSSQTVFSASSYSLLFRTDDGTPFGIDSSYFPQIYSTPVAPNIFPQALPLSTNGSSSTIDLLNTNDYVNSSLLVATIAPGGFDSCGYLSDHKRSPLSIDHEEIEQADRTVDGAMRFHHNATKRKFSLNWTDLPADEDGTVDGYWGGNDMLQVYKNNKGTFFLEVYNRESSKKSSNGPDLKVLVRFTSFQYDIVRRNFVISSSNQLTDLWNVSMTLEEV